jgi:NTE family protein
MPVSGPRVGLALGGGGARGLAHVAVLEVFDDLGLRPCAIAGTSMGAIIGALYASGRTGASLHESIHDLAITESARSRLRRGAGAGWLELVRPEWEKGGMLNVERFHDRLAGMISAASFEDLEIPLKVVAASFWEREQVVLDTGELLPALRASSALPALFRPVVIDGRVLIDGGAVNPVPFDLVADDCDLTVAVNVAGRPRRPRRRREGMPTLTQALFNTFQIAQATIVRQKLERRRPDIYIEPDIVGIRVLEFQRADEILEHAEPAKRQLRAELEAALALDG